MTRLDAFALGLLAGLAAYAVGDWLSRQWTILTRDCPHRDGIVWRPHCPVCRGWHRLLPALLVLLVVTAATAAQKPSAPADKPPVKALVFRVGCVLRGPTGLTLPTGWRLLRARVRHPATSGVPAVVVTADTPTFAQLGVAPGAEVKLRLLSRAVLPYEVQQFARSVPTCDQRTVRLVGIRS